MVLLRHRFRNATCVVVLALSALSPATASAAPVDDQLALQQGLAAGIREHFGTTAQLDAALKRAYGQNLPPDKAAVGRKLLRSVLFHEALPAYLARFVAPFAPSLQVQDAQAAVMQGVLQLQVKGLARLSSDQQAWFIRHVVATAQSLPPSICKSLYMGHMGTEEAGQLERQYIAALPLHKFEAVASFYQQAAQAELIGFPDARQITPEQARLADKANQAAVDRRFAKLPPATLVAIGSDMEGAPAQAVCDAVSETLLAMTDLDEPYRAWQLARFIASVN